MNSPLVRRLVSVLVLLASTAASACATASPAAPERNGDRLAALRRHPALRDVEPALLRTAEIPLRTLDVQAVRVDIIDRAPVTELVFARAGDDWLLSLVNKSLGRDWRKAAEALAGGRADAVCSLDAGALAEDFARLFVDPSPRYGIVLSSPESVPTDYRSSDVLRDLERSGLPAPEIRAALLRKVPSRIRPPELRCDGDRARLAFFTWHYFAGEIASWEVQFRPRVRVQRKTLASGAGSYDYYY